MHVSMSEPPRPRTKTATAGLVVVIFFAVAVAKSLGAGGASSRPASEWDKSLPSMVLEDVHLEGDSLINTWNQMVQRFLLRTVLFSVGGDAVVPQRFSYTAARCQASELLDALIATYSDATWTQDPECGVIWIHPRKVPYETILQQQVDIPSNELGIPMQDGILESLAAISGGKWVPWPGSTGFRNTFDYPVDLKAGRHSVRDILNQCCAASPTVTLLISERVTPVKDTLIRPVNLPLLKYGTLPSPGALQIWRLGVGAVGKEGPSVETICQKLADPDPSVRSAARLYSQAESFRYPITKTARACTDAHQTEAWVWLAASEIVIRLEGIPFTEAVDRLRVLASEEALLTWPPELAVLTAMELARLGQDTRGLEVISRRQFKPGELKAVRSRMFAIARSSKEVREKLASGLAGRLAAADPAFTALAAVRPSPGAGASFERLREAAVVPFKLVEPAQTQPQP